MCPKLVCVEIIQNNKEANQVIQITAGDDATIRNTEDYKVIPATEEDNDQNIQTAVGENQNIQATDGDNQETWITEKDYQNNQISGEDYQNPHTTEDVNPHTPNIVDATERDYASSPEAIEVPEDDHHSDSEISHTSNVDYQISPELVQITEADYQYLTTAHNPEKNKMAEGHMCGMCGLSFKFRYQFQRHVRLHIHEKSYECVHCGEDFLCLTLLEHHESDLCCYKPQKKEQTGTTPCYLIYF